MGIPTSVYKHPSFAGLIGVSQQDITPPVGIYSRNWGAAAYDVAEGIHQPLKLTCLSFQNSANEKPLVLISADLGWWKRSLDEWTLRGKLLEALELEPSRLMFCLSHTHAGPGICTDDKDKPGGHLIAPYLQYILGQSVLAARQSLASAKPAVLTWHYGKSALATNRDLPQQDKDRLAVGFNPGKPADDTLLVGRVTDSQGNTFATIVNYACHPTTLAWDNRLISPDYIGSMRETVEQQIASPCLFLQGASGELAPAEQYVGETALAERYGRQLGYDVLSTLESMLAPSTKLSFSKIIESGAPLAVWKNTEYQPASTLLAELVKVSLPLKALPSLSEIEMEWAQTNDRVLKERLLRKRGVRQAVGDSDHAAIGLWVWRLGDSVIIGQPNEAYSCFQQALRQQLAPAAVAVINVANGHIGYLPPQELYNQDMYSVWQTPFAAGSLEALKRQALETANHLLSQIG